MYKDYKPYDPFTPFDANSLLRQGRIPVANSGERSQITNPTEGMEVYRLDTHAVERYIGGAWKEVAPFAIAAGVATIAASGITTVTFPAGRFTVPPIITATVVGSGNVAVAHVDTPTKDSVGIRMYTIGGGQIAGGVHWVAYQLSSATAAG